MSNKLHNKKYKIGAAAIAIIFLGSALAIPMSYADDSNETNDFLTKPFDVSSTGDAMAWLDRSYPNENEIFLAVDQNDMGYNTDAKEKIGQSIPLYVGEPIDQTVPGRGRQGTLALDDGDKEDWFAFSACEGQNIQASVSKFNIEICDSKGAPVGQSYAVDITGTYFVRIYADAGATAGDYTLTVTVSGQNDAGKGSDAGNALGSATAITAGNYDGYLTYTDTEDWYSFSANSGDGIFITVEALESREGDFDIHLYNPSGTLVDYAMYYSNDELEYPADASGTWKFKISQWPGWDTEKWPDNYFLYGSGAYEMSLSVGGTAEPNVGPVPQTQVTPIAQTFKIANDPDSSDDEYAFLAAVPAAVYQEGGKQYVSPVVYTGDSTPTSYFGTADDTTQYLLDDWQEYLSHFDFNATVYEVTNEPIVAAADIALNGWTTANTAVLAVDGSSFTDTIGILDIDQDATLNVKTEKTVATPADLKTFAGNQAVQMWIGKQWGAMTLYLHGSACPAVGLINMRYESSAYEDWPFPYDGQGDNTNIYFPVELPGLHWPYVDSATGWDTFEITKYSCDRYTVNVDNSDTSIYATVTTTEPSYLEVFLIDPEGLARRPSMPMWNGGEIQPVHIWNGGHWQHNYDAYRRWEPILSTEHAVNIHYPSEGKWTVMVTPHYPYGQEKTSDSIPYHITIENREHSTLRTNAGLSAANGAVLASQIHAPLLYVTEDSVPPETQNALNQLGVTEILFVNINDISSAVPSGSVMEINSMQEIINMVQSYSGKIQPATATSDKVITITSFGSEDGFFAPAGLIAAYHGANVLNIGEVPEVYNLIDKGTEYRILSGGWYHGVRAQGHTSKSSEPIPSVPEIIMGILSGDFPPLGLDNDLRWWGGTYDGIYNWVNEKGLTGPGQECYIFVAPRWTDIRHTVICQMMGIGSYAGQFPMDTASLDAAHISRCILYPAIIFANPGKDVTTSDLMNFPDGWQWTTNDGARTTVFSTRETKESFSSHGRFYEGHTTFEGWLTRINEGASISYYSGHGTGGSGVSFQWMNIEEQFPLVEPTHESLKDFNWWDGWRGYMYDDTQTKDPRWGGFTWYNAKEPNLYNLVHYKWMDYYLQNMHSEMETWMSCTTGQNMGPHIYLEHGAVLWFGNAGTGLCPEEDALDDMWFKDMMRNGSSIGQAFSKYVWLHQRDFSAKLDNPAIYEMSLYGSSTMQVTNVQVLYGDPTLTCASPEWVEPVPVLP